LALRPFAGARSRTAACVLTTYLAKTVLPEAQGVLEGRTRVV
jgi:hypothetical protein